MKRARRFPRVVLLTSLLLAAGLGAWGCAKVEPPAPSLLWVMPGAAPAFDPDGPPDAGRWALERLLTTGLVARDSSGMVQPAAAAWVEVPPDSLTYTFHLRPGLNFGDTARCTSANFRVALESGLARTDHQTQLWLLSAIRGMDRVRAGRPLPKLGIETPDDTTLVLRLWRPDPWLLRKLALPGVSDVWEDRSAGSWKQARGIGAFRVIHPDSAGPLVLVRRVGDAATGKPDTIRVRLGASGRRVRSLLRHGTPDLVWPVPPGLLDEALPSGYRLATRPARPRRRLLLVMRADTPPTTKIEARRAMVHALNHQALLRRLEGTARQPQRWFDPDAPFVFPSFDPYEVRRWMARGRLGASFSVRIAYDGDGPGATLARPMQVDWAEQAINVDLRTLHGSGFEREALTGRAQVLLVEAQGLLDDAAAELATLVMPLRGPAVGSFRTGWRTREFDRWIAPRRVPTPLPGDMVKERLEEECVVAPLARLPWSWIEREGAEAIRCDVRFGPQPDPAGRKVRVRR